MLQAPERGCCQVQIGVMRGGSLRSPCWWGFAFCAAEMHCAEKIEGAEGAVHVNLDYAVLFAGNKIV